MIIGGNCEEEMVTFEFIAEKEDQKMKKNPQIQYELKYISIKWLILKKNKPFFPKIW